MNQNDHSPCGRRRSSGRFPDVGQVRNEGIQGPTVLDEKEARMPLLNR